MDGASGSKTKKNKIAQGQLWKTVCCPKKLDLSYCNWKI